MRPALLLLSLLAAAPAHADWARDRFAWFFQVDVATVQDVTAYKTPAGVAVTHILVGHFQEGPQRHAVAGIVLLRCNETQCDGSRVWLDPFTAKFEVLGLADLRAPGRLGEHTGRNSPSLGMIELDYFARPPIKYQFPALMVLATESTPMTTASRFGGEVTGQHREGTLWLLSLRAAEAADPVLLQAPTESIYPTGAGTHTSYRTVRGDNPAVFDLVATEQRELESMSACLRPEPIEYRMVLEKGRFQRKGTDPYRSSGCH